MTCCIPPDGSPLVAVLAGGRASRFGGGKLDAELAGQRVGQWTLDAVAKAGLPQGVIVVGEETPQFASESGWAIAVNPRAAEGLGTSLALAAGRALALARPLLVLLADMPLIPAQHIRELATGGELAATSYGDGKRGVPAYFSKAVLPQLTLLSGDVGAGPFLSEQADCRVLDLPTDCLLDIDRAEDIERIARLLEA